MASPAHPRCTCPLDPTPPRVHRLLVRKSTPGFNKEALREARESTRKWSQIPSREVVAPDLPLLQIPVSLAAPATCVASVNCPKSFMWTPIFHRMITPLGSNVHGPTSLHCLWSDAGEVYCSHSGAPITVVGISWLLRLQH